MYRRTPSVVTRLEDNRARILAAARALVAEGGWRLAHVATVAEKAGVATGTVYRYFPSKAELFAEVLANVSRRERDVVAAIVDGDGTPAIRMKGAVRAFASRALRGRRLAHAMIVEPCDPEIDAARLVWRAALGEEFVRLIRMGQQQGDFADCDPRIAAACVVGAFMEALVGPLAPEAFAGEADARRLIEEIADACLAIATRKPGQPAIRPEHHMTLATGAATHRVLNQARPALGWNAFTGDAVLRGIAGRLAPWVADKAAALGGLAGDQDVQELARLANRYTPELRTHDRYGHRIDWVEFHPAWHELMALAVGHEVHSLAWTTEHPGAHVGRGLLSYVWNQIEHGVACPMGMTYAAWPGLSQPEFAPWRQKILSPTYDRRPLHYRQKGGVTIGYAMTEKQGGSDLRQTQTTARFAETTTEGRAYLITGHKWFFSVPQSDAFFTLARTDSGVSCFFVPGFLPDGSRNAVRIQRLKDKCGNRSNASSEVEFADTLGWLVGEEGHGIREILGHAHLTRLDFAIGSAGLMRQALTLALNHAQSRRGFGSTLAEQPMMGNILADLAIDCEASTLMAFRAAGATDGMSSNDAERHLARVTTPLAKFWNCKRAPAFVVEALECHGGNGFIEENPMARLYREAPLNAIWEGTSNMMCMDVLRALRREPATAEAFMAEVSQARGSERNLDGWLDRLGDEIGRQRNDDGHARRLCQLMAYALQARALQQHAAPEVFEAFCRSRLQGDWGHVYGTLDPSPELKGIVERATVMQH